jgi:ABC-2 type transport system ATP-binding protein
MTAAIEVEAITRHFRSGRQRVQALDNVSFAVEPGSVLAVLGVNGAGKPTLTRIISTLLLPDSGQVRVLDHDVVKDAKWVRSVTSVIFGGDRGLYTRLTGRANLRFFGMLAGVSRLELARRLPEVLDQVGLSPNADRRVETYSKGMRQRLHIAIGLVSRPMVLLLDEPTIGLDPIEAARLRQSIKDLRTAGATILLTSHYLLDVEELADRVLLLHQGGVKADLSLADFTAAAGYAAVVELRGRGAPPLADLVGSGSVTIGPPSMPGEDWTATVVLRTWGAEVLAELAGLLREIEVLDMQVRPARLEEAYARLSESSVR